MLQGTFSHKPVGMLNILDMIDAKHSIAIADKIAGEIGNQLANILVSYAGTNAKLRLKGIPTVLVSHGTVDGSMNESGVAMINLDHEFTRGSLYSVGTDAVVLGHIHIYKS